MHVEDTFNWIPPLNIIVLGDVLVAYLVRYFLAFDGIRGFITVPYSQNLHNASYMNPLHFLIRRCLHILDV